MDIAAEIALEVNAQWEMFLANSYEYKELEKLDLSTIRLPVIWFSDWLKQLKDA